MKTRKATTPLGEGLDLKDLLDCCVIRKNGKVYVSKISFENYLVPFKGIYNVEITFTACMDDALMIKSESLAGFLCALTSENLGKDKIEIVLVRDIMK